MLTEVPRPLTYSDMKATLAAANTDVTITINAHGEVNVDQVHWSHSRIAYNCFN